MEQVVNNAKVLAECLQYYGFNVLTGGTDNHLVLLDLRNKGITGQELENRLANCHIITNKNAVPFDTEKKTVTSGIRLGTPAITSRGMGENEVRMIASLIDVCASPYYEANIEAVRAHVADLCEKFPLYEEDK
jgi:glycine hydroxymethyltransferase